MATSHDNIVGMHARGSDGGAIGRIIECGREGFTTERRGLIFPHDTYIPYDEIALVEGDDVVLRDRASYYREGGDMDDGHWTAEKGRLSRLVRQDGVAHEVGLADGRSR